METKHLNALFDIKEVSDEGTFEGLASVYGVVDEGGDVVEKGAFSRTINARPEVAILWRHDAPIGKGRLEDGPTGLMIKGRLTLAVGQAKEALALMKDGVVRGLSIGFQSVKAKEEIRDGIRYLREVKLWEVSLTPFPMNQQALVTAVKERKDFTEELDSVQAMSSHYMKMTALDAALTDCMYMEGDDAAKTAEAATCIDQFKVAYMQGFAQYLMVRARMMAEMEGFKEIKEGRMMSAATRARIESVMSDHRAIMEKLQALLDEGSSNAKEGIADPKPAAPSPDPVIDHSAIVSRLEEIKGELAWNL